MARSSTSPSRPWRTLARNHDFTVLWIGQTVSELGSRISVFVYPLIGYALTGSTTWAAAIEGAYLLGLVAALLPAGVLADRFDRRRIMRLSAGAGVLLYASLAVAGLLDALTLGHLIAVALATGAASGLFSPAETSAVRTVVPREEMPAAMAQQQARQHIAGLVGAPIGGVLYGLVRWLPFLADALSYAIAWVCIGRVHADLSPARGAAGAGRENGRTRRPLHDIREGVSFTWSQPFLRVLLLWSPLVNLSMNALFFVAVLRLVRDGTAPAQIAAVEVVGAVCGLVGAALAPWLIARFATGRLTLAVAWTMLPMMVPMAWWSGAPVIAAALGVILLLNPAGNAGVSSYRMAITPPDLIGRVQSAMQFTSMLPMPLAPVIAGALLSGLGGRDAILALTGLTGLVALIPTLSRAVRSIPRPSEWEQPGATTVSVTSAA